MKTQVKRGKYNEINIIDLPEQTRKQVRNLINEAKQAAKIDEHGSWDFKAEFDSKGRGEAINYDLYAVGRDIHSRKLLIVLQIRQFVRRRKNGFGNVRKNYFLVGRNEDKSTFAHAVESRVIHSAISSGREVVKAVQDWIFNADYKKVIRQGDIALVPISKPQGIKVAKGSIIIEASHLLTADEYTVNGSLYAKNPEMVHVPGTHPKVSAVGWYKIVIGTRARHWSFAAPTID